jgi:phage tail sheath gpL-like
MPSNAVGLDLISRVVGYKVTKGDFRTIAPNLPQRIAILGEANENKQAGLTTSPVELKSAKEAGDKFGYGSPIHMAMRILKPLQSDGVGGIPVVAYPQLKAAGATATTIATNKITSTTSFAVGSKIEISIAGRDSLDGKSYSIETVPDCLLTIQKAVDSINANSSSPFLATLSANPPQTTLSTALTVKTLPYFAGFVLSTIEVPIDVTATIIANTTDITFTYLDAGLVQQTWSGKASSVVFAAGKTTITPNFVGYTPISANGTLMVANQTLTAYTGASPQYGILLTSKWAGLTSASLNATISCTDANIVFALTKTNGTGTPDISPSLDLFQNEWNTIVINTYGVVSSVLDKLEFYNGIADPTNPTGRYRGIVFKPFIALAGSINDNDSAVTDARSSQMTNAICPAPLSEGHPLEAAANMCYLLATTSNENPHLDVCGLSYFDMPTPSTIGTMQVYANRDIYVKKGNSTVDLVAGKYQVQDFVTTYHLAGEIVPQFRFVRNLMLDFNVRYGYFLLEQINVVDHVIVNDDDVTNAPKVVKPKQWKAVLFDYADSLSNRALIADASFMQDSIEVDLSSTNPDRLETFFRYKRSGVARISSTTAEAGFNFGN